MKRNAVIILVLLSFLMASPALAVKRVSKTDDQAREERQKDNQGTPDTPSKATPPAATQPDRPESTQRPERVREPERPSKGGDRDRFIDENGDGINDKLKTPPETIKKKKETKSDNSEKKTRKR